jgi:hypothetical protein
MPGAIYNLSYLLQNTFNSAENFTAFGISSWTATVNGRVLDTLLGPPANWPEYMLRTALWTAPAGISRAELSFGFQQVCPQMFVPGVSPAAHNCARGLVHASKGTVHENALSASGTQCCEAFLALRLGCNLCNNVVACVKLPCESNVGEAASPTRFRRCVSCAWLHKTKTIRFLSHSHLTTSNRHSMPCFANRDLCLYNWYRFVFAACE